MGYYLVLLYTERYPESKKSPDTHDFILLTEGFDVDEATGDVDPLSWKHCGFATTMVLRTNDIRTCITEIEAWWNGLTESSCRLEIIANELRAMSKDQQKSAKSLDVDAWSYRIPFIGYCRDSESAGIQVRDFLVDTSTKDPKTFWQ